LSTRAEEGMKWSQGATAWTRETYPSGAVSRRVKREGLGPAAQRLLASPLLACCALCCCSRSLVSRPRPSLLRPSVSPPPPNQSPCRPTMSREMRTYSSRARHQLARARAPLVPRRCSRQRWRGVSRLACLRRTLALRSLASAALGVPRVTCATWRSTAPEQRAHQHHQHHQQQRSVGAVPRTLARCAAQLAL